VAAPLPAADSHAARPYRTVRSGGTLPTPDLRRDVGTAESAAHHTPCHMQDRCGQLKKMKRILVTGATGNIGLEVIHYLNELNFDSEILAAVRNIEKAKKTFKNYPGLLFRPFDFENESTYSVAFDQIDILFLLRPPHISDVEKVFRPLLNSAREKGVNKIVFLSVQGAEKSKVIPHNKIERLIQELNFLYIFVRPSYFMQNLITTLLPEILAKKSITLPSGNAKFNWIDVKTLVKRLQISH